MKQFVEQIKQNKWGTAAVVCRVLFLAFALFPGSMLTAYSEPGGVRHFNYTNYFNSAIPCLTWYCMLIAAGFGLPKQNDHRWVSIVQAALALLAATALDVYLLNFHLNAAPPFLYAAMPVLAGLHLILSIGAVISKLWNSRRMKK